MFSDGSLTEANAPVLSTIVLNVPVGLERKIPLTAESLSPLSKAIWPSSLSDTRDERLLKLNPSGVGVSARNRWSNVPALDPTKRP